MTINKNKILNVPNLRFPGFTEDWKMVKFSEVGVFFKGSGISKDQLSDNGNPCILYGELYTKYKKEVIKEVVSKTNLPTKGLVKSQFNDIIIPSSGESAEDIATACCVNVRDVLLGGDLNVIRPHKDNGNFVSYQLNGKRKFEIAKIAQGSSVVHLYNEGLKKLNISLPQNVDEQNKIAALISFMDDRIETQNKIIEYQKTQMLGLQEKLLRRKLNLKDEYGKPFPEWKYKTGGELFESISNKDHNSDVSILAITQEYGAIPRDFIDYQISVTDKSVDSYKVVEVGDFIISLRSFQGGIEYSNYKGICSPAYIILRNKIKIEATFYKYYFKTPDYIKLLNKKLEGIRDGKMISYAYFSEITLPFPSLKEQKRITDIISAFVQKIEIEKNILKHYEAQKKYLLQNIFI